MKNKLRSDSEILDYVIRSHSSSIMKLYDKDSYLFTKISIEEFDRMHKQRLWIPSEEECSVYTAYYIGVRKSKAYYIRHSDRWGIIRCKWMESGALAWGKQAGATFTKKWFFEEEEPTPGKLSIGMVAV